MKLLTHIFTPTGAIRAWAATLMTIVGFGLALGLTIGYVAQNRREDDRRWCALLLILDTPVPTQAGPPAPLTDRAQRINQAIHQLRLSKHC